MPAYTISGLSSGQNTNDIIRKLLELEAKPIKRWEKENEYQKIQIKAWNELRNLTLNLQIKTKALTSFTAPFSSKKVSANEEGYITGEANRNAKSAKQEIEIMKLASKQKIAGSKVKLDTTLPAGQFSIISKDKRIDIDFAGGKLEDLQEKIRNFGSQIVKSNLMKVDSDNMVFSIHALQYGQEAAMKFLDPNGILQAAGIVGANVPEPAPTISSIRLSAEGQTSYQPEKFINNAKPEFAATPGVNGGVLIKQNTAFAFPVDKFRVEKLSYLEFYPEKTTGTIPDYLAIGIYYETKDGEKLKYENIPAKGGKYVVPVATFARDNLITKIVLGNTGDAEMTVSEVKFVVPGEIQGAAINNIIAPAENALFKIDGIEVTRDTNENIKDAIEGVSFNLIKETTQPITMEISVETNKGVVMIKEFVDAYNELIKYSKEVSTANKDAKVDLSTAAEDNNAVDISEEYWKNKTKSGILAGDNAIIRLVAGLKTATSASYPSSAEPRYKVLSDIGISTGELGSNWKQIQEGLLKIDESTLSIALNDNPESIRELFASDNNNDNRVDDGVGVAILEHLKPYTQLTSGLVTSKIKLAESTISENSKKVKDFESHLVSFEKKLKQKYLNMEQGVGKNKAVGSYLKNNFQRRGGDD
ncbi:MAG TPA: flagellar filament capping protein FliD [Leptospiraceae bacterium]|nr:flagellar filament capping protein FliD [Leptospiraceae bacterium]HRG76228.1 flagellar filament capping protein FliD [Leptospiraceae bacterium]